MTSYDNLLGSVYLKRASYYTSKMSLFRKSRELQFGTNNGEVRVLLLEKRGFWEMGVQGGDRFLLSWLWPGKEKGFLPSAG